LCYRYVEILMSAIIDTLSAGRRWTVAEIRDRMAITAHGQNIKASDVGRTALKLRKVLSNEANDEN